MTLSVPAELYDLARMTAPVCAKGMATVTGTTLNVRTGPGTEYAVSGQLAAGAVVDVWAVAGGWYWLQARDVRLDKDSELRLTGWCSAAWLKVTGRLLA